MAAWRRVPLRLAICAAAILATLALWLPAQLPRRYAAPTDPAHVVRVLPHDVRAYCQGLAFRDGFLFEGTGGYGTSSLRKVELETGRVVQQRDLAEQLFGEGITLWNNEIVQLTWKNGYAITYDHASFEPKRRINYRDPRRTWREGWGITHDGRQFIVSDGSATLRFLDPATFSVTRWLTVRDGSERISRLNELEYVEGEIYANVWYADRIARIAPDTGRVVGWIDLSELYPANQRPDRDDVLNGIAYDAAQQRLYVTGKHWPNLFEIRLP
ncbi:MAG: glutaminyl-peptide cyclotransferase [Planctomycetes bacterium]|nr:glutaminyl-peptide cyclotransferase [Planctomycetota bacterium]